MTTEKWYIHAKIPSQCRQLNFHWGICSLAETDVPQTYWKVRVKITKDTVTITGATLIDKPVPKLHKAEDWFNKECGISQEIQGNPAQLVEA